MNTSRLGVLYVATFFGFMVLPATALGATESLDTQQKGLRIISEFAESLCAIPLQGKSAEVQLSGNAKLELRNLLKKLADLGLSGAAKYQSSKWEGALQKDLAGLVAKKIDCKKQVWNDLKDKVGLRAKTIQNQPRRDSPERSIIPQDGKSSVIVGDIKDNTNTQINLNSPNSPQIINELRALKEEYTVNINKTDGSYVMRITMKQNSGIWNQGTIFKFYAKISVPYTNYEFVKGMPPVRTNWRTWDSPEKGIIRLETTTAPILDENIVVEIKSDTLASIEEINVAPLEKK